jgi:UDP-glucose 4-epimerase
MVIGGAGFIGSHLVDRLLAEGHVVDVVDDLSTGSLANLAAARAAGGELKIHHLDVCSDDFATLVAMRVPDVIFHLGSLPPGRITPAALARAVHGMLNVVEAGRLLGPTKVIAAVSATWVYGDVPARDQPIKEGRVAVPAGSTGVIAHAVLELLAAYRRDHDVEFTVLAMGSVYGARQRADGGVVAAFVDAARRGDAPVIIGDGRQARDFVYIDDAVDALVRAVSRGGGLIINIGTGASTSIRDLWALVAPPGASTPRHVAAVAGDVGRLSLSPTRARIQLAWAPWTSLEVGLRSAREGR